MFDFIDDYPGDNVSYPQNGLYIPDATECMHCGLCISLCPTYKLFRIEAETPRSRVRTIDKNAPRTIDLDILLFDQQCLDLNLWQTAFRAVPFAEVLPDFQSQSGESLKDPAVRLASMTPIWIRKDVLIFPFQNVP